MRKSRSITDEREASEPLAQDAFLRSKTARRSANKNAGVPRSVLKVEILLTRYGDLKRDAQS